jgi:hypothetical protein
MENNARKLVAGVSNKMWGRKKRHCLCDAEIEASERWRNVAEEAAWEQGGSECKGDLGWGSGMPFLSDLDGIFLLLGRTGVARTLIGIRGMAESGICLKKNLGKRMTRLEAVRKIIFVSAVYILGHIADVQLSPATDGG